MIKVCVTGATGYIGTALTQKLAFSGCTVHALYRSETKAALLDHPRIKLFKGDVLHSESLDKALKGCDYVYHTAAMTAVWSADPGLYYDINVTGTLNVLEKANKWGLKKVVMTSTAGVYGPSLSGPVHEECCREVPFFTEYEKTKEKSDCLALDFARETGLDLVVVCPTRVYGPGRLGRSNSVTMMIDRYIRGKWRVLPGNGRSIGNYVYIDDVVEGHILAMGKGRSGEKYLLGGTNISYSGFFEVLKEVAENHYTLIKIPFFCIKAAARMMTLVSRLTRRSPVITPEMVKKLSQDWIVSSRKAERELGYRATPLREGVSKTLGWLYPGVKGEGT